MINDIGVARSETGSKKRPRSVDDILGDVTQAMEPGTLVSGVNVDPSAAQGMEALLALPQERNTIVKGDRAFDVGAAGPMAPGAGPKQLTEVDASRADVFNRGGTNPVLSQTVSTADDQARAVARREQLIQGERDMSLTRELQNPESIKRYERETALAENLLNEEDALALAAGDPLKARQMIALSERGIDPVTGDRLEDLFNARDSQEMELGMKQDATRQKMALESANALEQVMQSRREGMSDVAYANELEAALQGEVSAGREDPYTLAAIELAGQGLGEQADRMLKLREGVDTAKPKLEFTTDPESGARVLTFGNSVQQVRVDAAEQTALEKDLSALDRQRSAAGQPPLSPAERTQAMEVYMQNKLNGRSPNDAMAQVVSLLVAKDSGLELPKQEEGFRFNRSAGAVPGSVDTEAVKDRVRNKLNLK